MQIAGEQRHSISPPNVLITSKNKSFLEILMGQLDLKMKQIGEKNQLKQLCYTGSLADLCHKWIRLLIRGNSGQYCFVHSIGDKSKRTVQLNIL